MESTNQTFQDYQNSKPNHQPAYGTPYICENTRMICEDEARSAEKTRIANYQNQINTQDGPAF